MDFETKLTKLREKLIEENIPEAYIDQLLGCVEEDADDLEGQVFNQCASEASYWEEIQATAVMAVREIEG